MFKKLKKKIEEETGGLSSPGLASGDHGTSSPSAYKKEIDTLSVSSETSETAEARSKEDVMRLLMKKNDQVRKFESKITDLAALIKEKNRTIDKLESSIEKQHEDHEKQLQELNQRFSAKRAKMKEGFVQLSEKREEEFNKEIEEFKRIQTDLEQKLVEAESSRDRVYQRQEEKEELKGLATQETAKLKHMLLLTQEELAKVKGELKERSSQLEVSTKQVKQLENEVTSLMQQIGTLTKTNEEIEDTNRSLTATVEDIRSQKEGVERQLQGLQKQVSSVRAELSALQKEHTQLEEQHQQLQRTTQVSNQKLTSLIEEKDNVITRLTERVSTLDQRLQDGDLTGDERVIALEAERELLEKKLEETREQLAQVKSSWSEKISQLEEQIIHLNQKHSEDRQEVAAAKKAAESRQAEFESQMYDLQSRLDDSHATAKTNWDLLADKERQMEKQKIAYENELLKTREKASDIEAELSVKVSSLETQVKMLEKALEAEKANCQAKIRNLESNHEEWLEKEIDNEKQLTTLEEQLKSMKTEIALREKEAQKAQTALDLRNREVGGVKDKSKKLEEELKSHKIIMEQHKIDLKSTQKQYEEAVRERDELMMSNASMSQDMESIRQRLSDKYSRLEEEVKMKDTSIAGLERAVEELQSELLESRNKLAEMEQQQLAAINEVESEEINALRAQITTLDNQLLEKTKTIKRQEQRLSDLKKTLQREFKVQALPNDDVDSSLAPPSGALAKSSSTPQGLDKLHENFASLHRSVFTNNMPHPSNGVVEATSPATISTTDVSLHLSAARSGGAKDQKGGARMPRGAQQTLGGNHKMEYQRDINFEYLRHVVLKFMLSRESEAVHLIKAVSVLLDFTKDEQKLLKDALEYKMSWFGYKSPTLVSGGQKAKVIPPSY